MRRGTVIAQEPRQYGIEAATRAYLVSFVAWRALAAQQDSGTTAIPRVSLFDGSAIAAPRYGLGQKITARFRAPTLCALARKVWSM